MLNRNCNFLTAIAISVIVAFVFSVLFYTGIITGTIAIFVFALSLSLLSLLTIGIFGISDNGLTRTRLCQNCYGLIFSVAGNILFSLLALSIPLVARNSRFYSLICTWNFLLYIKPN